MATTPDPALLADLRAALDSTYAIEREIGGGGMSRVFLGDERSLGRRVVLKVLPPELTAGVNRERFRREIQFAARLQHPHIVPLLAAGPVGGILYYTMPFVEGESLRNRLEKDGPMPAARVLAILQDVVDALAYAHSRGLVHRDIKPEHPDPAGARPGHRFRGREGHQRIAPRHRRHDHRGGGGHAGVHGAGAARRRSRGGSPDRKSTSLNSSP